MLVVQSSRAYPRVLLYHCHSSCDEQHEQHAKGRQTAAALGQGRHSRRQPVRCCTDDADAATADVDRGVSVASAAHQLLALIRVIVGTAVQVMNMRHHDDGVGGRDRGCDARNLTRSAGRRSDRLRCDGRLQLELPSGVAEQIRVQCRDSSGVVWWSEEMRSEAACWAAAGLLLSLLASLSVCCCCCSATATPVHASAHTTRDERADTFHWWTEAHIARLLRCADCRRRSVSLARFPPFEYAEYRSRIGPALGALSLP